MTFWRKVDVRDSTVPNTVYGTLAQLTTACCLWPLTYVIKVFKTSRMLGAFRLHRGVGPVIINMSRISVDLFFMSWIYVFLTLAWTFGLVHIKNNKDWIKQAISINASTTGSRVWIFLLLGCMIKKLIKIKI